MKSNMENENRGEIVNYQTDDGTCALRRKV